jgi:hypothetical protein
VVEDVDVLVDDDDEFPVMLTVLVVVETAVDVEVVVEEDVVL